MQLKFGLQMKLAGFSTLILACISSYGQAKVIKADSATLPKSIKYAGHIVRAVKWSDSAGLHYVIATETGRIYGKGEDDALFDAYLYAYHFIVARDSTKLAWRIYDYNKGCGLALDFHFIDKAFAVTDLDKNGVAEIWVMFKNSCHGDVSPVPTKIIMYEGEKKYALRGETRVKVSPTTYYGGDYTLDTNFKAGNRLFKQYAEALWKKFKVETWEGGR